MSIVKTKKELLEELKKLPDNDVIIMKEDTLYHVSSEDNYDGAIKIATVSELISNLTNIEEDGIVSFEMVPAKAVDVENEIDYDNVSYKDIPGEEIYAPIISITPYSQDIILDYVE